MEVKNLQIIYKITKNLHYLGSPAWYKNGLKTNILKGKFFVPNESKIKRFYNVGCTAYSTIASADNGVFGIGEELQYNGFYSNSVFSKLSSSVPDKIKQVFCCYNKFYILENDGTLIQSNSSTSHLILSSIELPVSYSSVPLPWNHNSHFFFSKSKRDLIFFFLLFCKKYNRKNLNKIPRVIVYIIINLFVK